MLEWGQGIGVFIIHCFLCFVTSNKPCSDRGFIGEGEESFVPHAEASKAPSRGILAPHTSNFELLSPSGKAIVTAVVGGT